MGAIDGYQITNNSIAHVNYNFTNPDVPNGNHNGVFHMIGHGVFRNNIGFNCQGNFIRAWGISFSPEFAETVLDHNLYVNCLKYGAFEIQVPPELDKFIKASTGRFNYVNVKVFNNTAGNLGTSNTSWAQMLDAYTTYASVTYYNNLGFDMLRRTNDGASVKSGITDMLVNYSGTPLKQNSGNKYFDSREKAVDVKYKSLHKGIGAF